jgi:hypothetical protein
LVLTDGRALVFDRVLRADGTGEVRKGEQIFPGGAIYKRGLKTKEMQDAEFVLWCLRQ